MKLLTRNADYGVRAICYLARKERNVVSVPELVEKLNIPRPFLRKILQVLNRKGLVRSYKGIGGGFQLARPAEDISVVDLIEAFQGPLRINECLFRRKLCPSRKRCALKERIDHIERYVVSEVSAIKIKDLIRPRF